LDSAEAQLEKMSLFSPLNGVVSRQDGTAGEMVAAGAPLIGLLSDAKYQVEGQLSQNDVAKVKVGQNATVNLDAYGSAREFPATVITVEPAGTIINGVSSYKVTLEFNQPDEAIKSGLSANVKILTAESKNVLLIPASALIKQGAKNYVLVNNQTPAGEKREVTVGIISAANQAEIKSGLNAGDQVADFGALK
jgi:RND family efflux transporter MFP subunit